MPFKRNLTAFAVFSVLWCAPAITVAQSRRAQPDAMEVLSDQSFWRFHAAWRTPATVAHGEYDLGGGYVVTDPPGTRWIRDSFSKPTPPPPPGWTATDFDDSTWARHLGPPLPGFGYGQAPEVYLLCGRVRFGVTDPARAGHLKLSLTYRGGVLVHLNGKEVARGDMPSGKIEPLTLAVDYPQEASFDSDGRPLPPVSEKRQPPVSEKRQPPADLLEHYRKRLRTLQLDLPADGSVIANAGSIPDSQIWNCNTLLRPGVDFHCGDPLEPLRPVRMATPQGGVSSGQVVVSSTRALDGVSATLSSLKTESGAILPAGCVSIRYATTDGNIPRLLDRPPGPTQILPIWLTARVSRFTAPGKYLGTLTISGLEEKVSVPVELRAYDWTLPELRDFDTTACLLHCPESIARHYRVPLWSDEHFKLIEKSMALMGYGGNTLVSVSAIGEDWFGDHPAIVFRREGGRYVPDFRFVRRYLQLYDKHAGPPRQLSVQVWNYSVSRRGFGRDGGDRKWMCKTLRIRILEGDRLVPAEMPVYTQPGTEQTWTAVAAGMKQILDQLGWNNTRLLWGTGGDNLPTEEIVQFFKKIAPEVYWRVATHGGSVRNWGRMPEDRTQPGGLILGHASLVRRNITRRPLVEDCPFEVIKRDGVASVAIDYLSMAPLGRIAAGYGGMAFLNFDYWSVITDDRGRQRSPLGAYVGFGNIHGSGGAFVAPGPDGAAPSPQLEALREGLQVTEAILHLRAALADPARRAAIDPEMVTEAEAVIETLMDVMESNRRYRPAGTADVWHYVRRIYELAGVATSSTRQISDVYPDIRLFVEVTDPGGSVGYANLPFWVEGRAAVVQPAEVSRFEHFVTRDGDRLIEGDKPLRFVGVNMPGLVLPYDYWANRPDRMVLPNAWEQEDGFKTLARMHMGCVRTWNLPIRKPGRPKQSWQYVWGPEEFNEKAFVTLDRVLALANKYGVRVMIPLTADAGDYLGGVAEYAAHRGKDRKAFFSDPQVMADFKATIHHVLTRINTVTGIPYKDDKAILAWQFGNEMDRTRPGDEVQRRWQAEMAAYIKSVDPNHPVAYGRRFLPEDPDPNIDIVVDHYYGSEWARRLPGDYARTKGKRPFVISGFGMLTDAEPYRELLDEVIASGTSGIMVWSMYFHHRDGGFWWHAIPTDRSQGKMFSYHWPGFAIGNSIDERPILHALRSASYRIQGLPVASRTPPEAPQLLPFEKVPMFSWRGAAGAAAYDVQRAARPEGPWSTIAAGISDAEVAYRPLYSDTSARPGRQWCYRVIARNEAGSSPPSNVVGPLRIDGLCLVDELKDLELVEAHSDGLLLDNTYGSYYCEHLYRVRGRAGQWLLYKAPLAVDRVELVAWNPEAKPALKLFASTDGRDYRPVGASEKPHTSTAYDKREITELRVTASPPRGCRWVRIAFDGAVDLDRIELHCGRKSRGTVP